MIGKNQDLEGGLSNRVELAGRVEGLMKASDRLSNAIGGGTSAEKKGGGVPLGGGVHRAGVAGGGGKLLPTPPVTPFLSQGGGSYAGGVKGGASAKGEGSAGTGGSSTVTERLAKIHKSFAALRQERAQEIPY